MNVFRKSINGMINGRIFDSPVGLQDAGISYIAICHFGFNSHSATAPSVSLLVRSRQSFCCRLVMWGAVAHPVNREDWGLNPLAAISKFC